MSQTTATGTILDRIVETKRAEVAALRGRRGGTARELAERCVDLPPTRGFASALKRAVETRGVALIAEVKKASPSKGVIRADFDPVVIAQAYERGGATCLSVLTDEKYFQGSLGYLAAIREVVALPLLRKDFLIDPLQVYEARLAGADAILLIVSCVPSPARLAEMRHVGETLGMDALVEVHDDHELAIAAESGATLIGVNNRALRTFEVSLETTARLMPSFPAGALAVAESGIFTPADVAAVRAAGAHAVLVGESLMRAEDIEAATRALLADAAGPELRNNAHIHLPPNFSAFDTVAQAVAQADRENVRLLGVSNYYDYAVYRDFAAQAAERGIFPLFGLEIISRIDDLLERGIKINDPGNPGKMYICGKGITRFDPMDPEAADLLATIRTNDAERMARMTARLADLCAMHGLETGLDAAAIQARVARRHGCPVGSVYLQERHLAQAFQEALFEQVLVEARGATLAGLFGTSSKAAPDDAVGIQGEIRSHLMKAGKAAFVEETFVGFDHAYRLILALGGIPCYPTLADGASPICAYEASVEDLIADLKARNIPAAEFIPVRNDPEVLAHYVRAMRRAGLVITAGTEHNTLDLLPLEPTCLKGQPIPDDVKAIFREGACVVAAHQHRTQEGCPGFVDRDGNLNREYATDEERIAGFARLGESVIGEYQRNVPTVT